MSANDPRQELDLRDEASTAAGPATDVPRRLEDSPIVNEPTAGISPATLSRADLPANPGAGMMMDTKNNPLPVNQPSGEAVMTRREPDVDPGSPLGPGMGAIVGDVAGSGRLDQANAGDRMRGAEEAQLADHGGAIPALEGAIAGLDETSGVDDPSATAGGDARRVNPR